MSYTNGLDKPSDYFNTVLYTGNGSTNAITGVGFQPDWVWIKDRGAVEHHRLFDSVRGATKHLATSITDAEVTHSDSLTSFDSDGFTLGADSNSFGINENTQTKVAWNWLGANASSSNTDGSITSSVSANTTAGFSIVSYTGTGSGTPTVGHGLGAVPKMIILKPRSLSSSNWSVYHSSLGASKVTRLNNDNASFTGTAWNSTNPTSSVFTITTDYDTNQSSATYIAYCFAEKKGYSKFGSYTGNGSSSGPMIWTGMKPSFVMLKPTSTTGNWFILDNKRSSFNVMDKYIRANQSSAEATFSMMDFVSNGIKIITSDSSINGSGVSYIYMAFAENPFVTSSGIPTTAR